MVKLMYSLFGRNVYMFYMFFVILWFFMIFLALSNGKCSDPLINICDTKLYFMSHVYLFFIFLEYYLATGIHAVCVLEINQFRRIPFKELLKYSLFNLPLLIIVLLYVVFKLIIEIKNLAQKLIDRNFSFWKDRVFLQSNICTGKVFETYMNLKIYQINFISFYTAKGIL